MSATAFDLYCGLGGWAEGFLSEGFRVIGFDIEAHDYGTGGYSGELVLRDVRSLLGVELVREYGIPAVIVGSPPCQEPSYRAMPWKNAKAEVPTVLPDWWTKPESKMSRAEATEWVKWRTEHPRPAPVLFITLFNECFRIQREVSEAVGRYIPLIVENVQGAQKWVGRAAWHFGSYYLWGDVPALMPITLKADHTKTVGHLNIRDGHTHTWHLTNQAEHIKNEGGSWFAIAHNTVSGHSRNPVGAGIKQPGISRPAASALIAKIPFPLAQHIARCFKPDRLNSGNPNSTPYRTGESK